MVLPIEQIRLKIARSRKHLVELNAEISTFLRGSPYQVAVKRHPETRRLIYFVSRVDEAPSTIAVIAGDVLHSLRSALDHLAYRLVLAGTGGVMPGRNVHFPIADSLRNYEANKQKCLIGVRPEAMSAVDAVKPYRGGNDALWRLHKLNNVDKHRFLLAVGSAFHSLDVGAHMQQHIEKALPGLNQGGGLQLPPIVLSPKDRLFPLKVGDELFLDAPDAEPNERIEFKFEVAFQEPEADVLNGEPLMETLSELVTTVESVINQLAPLV